MRSELFGARCAAYEAGESREFEFSVLSLFPFLPPSKENLFQVKRKRLAAARRKAHNPELLMEYFMMYPYKSVVDEFGILPGDQWNSDETGYRIGIAREDWVILVDVLRRVYSGCPDNQQSLTATKCINGDGGDIPPMLMGTARLTPVFATLTPCGRPNQNLR